MALTINTNVNSLNAQRNLSASQSSLSQAMQRLSSGLRINSAKDDAAGMAIASRMTTQINGLAQAQRNASDGISLAQTTEGALGEVTNNLQRIRELAVQAANASNSSSDRTALDNEVQQRLQEIERIASQTSFNGQKVLDGSFGTAVFQVGANVGETVSIGLTQGVKASQMGQIATATSGQVTTTALAANAGTIQVGSNAAVTVRASVAGAANGQSASSAYAKAAAINSSNIQGLTATATNKVEFTVADIAANAGGRENLSINGVAIYSNTDVGTVGISAQQLTDAINGASNQTGVTASLDGANHLLLTSTDGRDISVGETATATAAPAGALTAGAANDVAGYSAGLLDSAANVAPGGTPAAAKINTGTVTLSASEAITVSSGLTVDLGLSATAVAVSIAKDSTTLDSQSVKTVTGANAMIQRIDAALTGVANLQSALGAIQSRFQSVVSSVQTAAQNLQSSRSAIQDADFAAETANMTRAQILQQAGTAILAQANSAPQSVLKLLQ